MTVQYLALGAYCLLCKALLVICFLYTIPSIAFDNDGMLRSLSGIITLQRAWARYFLSMLYCHIYVVLLLVAEAHHKEQPLLVPIAALMLGSGIGIACFDVDTHWDLHFFSLVCYLFFVNTYASLLTMVYPKFLIYKIYLDVSVTAFLMWFFYNLAVRKRYWDSVQTILELVWFFGLYLFFSRCCLYLANVTDCTEEKNCAAEIPL